MNQIQIITSNNARDFNQQLSQAFEHNGELVGGIKSLPRGNEDYDGCEYDYITFVRYP